MKKTAIIFCLFVSVFASCKRELTRSAYFVSPEEGNRIKRGSTLTLRLGDVGTFDSVQYLLDTTHVGSKQDTGALSVSSANLGLGIRIVTAKIFHGNDVKETTTNVVVLPENAPLRYTYQVVNSFPHDSSAYTQGLEYHDGIFYESDGGYASQGDIGGSSLRKVEPATGKVLKKLDMPENVFAEGITLVGDKLIQLTWQNRIGFVYNKSSFEKLAEFPYQSSAEGWGLCFDGNKIYKSDGSNKIYTLNKDTYLEEGYVEVYDQNGPVDMLNELEWIDGQIYANVYETDRIVRIDPRSGAVTGDINMAGLLPAKDRFENTNVLNGIAWDAQGKRLFVTGKKWNTLFEIKLKEVQ